MAVCWMTTAVLCLSLVSQVQAKEIANGVMQCYAGKVVCNEGYVYTSDDTFFKDEVHCGECRRAVWSGEEAGVLRGLDRGFPMPRVPRAGWAVCVTAVPTRFTRASVDFLGDEGRMFVSHFDIRMEGQAYDSSFGETVVINEAVMDENGGYDWGEQDTYHPYPYPFAVGEVFTVRIVAKGEHLLMYYVNGKKVASRQLQNSIGQVTHVVVQGSVDISQVNVWCQ